LAGAPVAAPLEAAWESIRTGLRRDLGDQLAFGTFLTRITFPYLLLISLVSLFSGIDPHRPSP
jgi:peptidoglycan biosynthesis protein MviN/MurJ (putative lipid II flippase)